jgi:branched-chain amino acid aminotransferase
MTLAADLLGMKTQERPVEFLKEVADIEEFAACGTAAVISPVGSIRAGDTWHRFYGNGESIGPVTQQLYDLLMAIQKGEREDAYGWTRPV